MSIELVFADGCTGEPDEVVTITMAKAVWSGMRLWLLGHGGGKRKPKDMDALRRTLCERIAERDFVEIGDTSATMSVPRDAADWIMAYYEIVSNDRIVLRRPNVEWYPINRVQVASRKMGI